MRAKKDTGETSQKDRLKYLSSEEHLNSTYTLIEVEAMTSEDDLRILEEHLDQDLIQSLKQSNRFTSTDEFYEKFKYIKLFCRKYPSYDIEGFGQPIRIGHNYFENFRESFIQKKE